ncbi:MAG: hypothetical protein NTX73_02275 [Rhodobacterales bacterium]|nr:hypothetical protein [Rhodobacterales bacterium]
MGELIHGDDCEEQPDGTIGMGMWPAFSNQVNRVTTMKSLVIISGTQLRVL